MAPRPLRACHPLGEEIYAAGDRTHSAGRGETGCVLAVSAADRPGSTRPNSISRHQLEDSLLLTTVTSLGGAYICTVGDLPLMGRTRPFDPYETILSRGHSSGRYIMVSERTGGNV